MPRYAKPNQTIDDLKNKILAGFKDPDGDPADGDVGYAVFKVLGGYGTQKIKDDLSKIEVDGENAELIGEFDMPGTEDLEQFEMLNGVPIAWCAMGGDWEMPIVVVLYIGDKGELRAYIPKDGNAYNKKAKAAYGNDDEEEFDEDKDYVFDADKLREDVKNRIQLKIKPSLRYAKANQTIDDLKNKLVDIANQIESDEKDVLESDGYRFLQDLLSERRDIWKEIYDACSFDYSNTGWANSGNENLPILKLEPFEMVNGIPVAWCCAANDCEWAIVFAFYIGDDGELHGYLPSDGNFFNKKDKSPWEDGEIYDDDGEILMLGDADKYDVDKLREDVKARIQLKV